MRKIKSRCCGTKAYTLKEWIGCKETEDKTDEYVCSECGSLCEIIKSGQKGGLNEKVKPTG